MEYLNYGSLAFIIGKKNAKSLTWVFSSKMKKTQVNFKNFEIINKLVKIFNIP